MQASQSSKCREPCHALVLDARTSLDYPQLRAETCTSSRATVSSSLFPSRRSSHAPALYHNPNSLPLSFKELHICARRGRSSPSIRSTPAANFSLSNTACTSQTRYTLRPIARPGVVARRLVPQQQIKQHLQPTFEIEVILLQLIAPSSAPGLVNTSSTTRPCIPPTSILLCHRRKRVRWLQKPSCLIKKRSLAYRRIR